MKRFLLKLWTAIRNFFCPKKSDMKIFNKVVWGKVAPENKNDIWFDGSTFKHYKNDDWFPMTLTKEEVQEMLNTIKVGTPDWKALEGEDGFIKNKPFYSAFRKSEEFIISENNTLHALSREVDENYQYNNILNVVINGEEYNLRDNLTVPIGSGSYIKFYDIHIDEFTTEFYTEYYRDSMDIHDKLAPEFLHIELKEYGITRIDEQFIPLTIARQSYVESLEARIQALENK